MSGPDDLIAGRYRLLTRVGSGGMGVVWRGWDERLRRPVAVKVLADAGGDEVLAGRAAQRAMREALITARLHHPHAVAVYDVVEHSGRPCLIMEYIASPSLQDWIDERGSLGVDEVALIATQVAAALVVAHRMGVVHRDIKPANILLGDGHAKITDFGISHAFGDTSITTTGMVTGTPAYLAPEVARGALADFRSDVFSFGATVYAALEGVPPFGLDGNAIAVLHRVASGRLIPPRHGGRLTALVNLMLQPEPDRRPTMAQVERALLRADQDRRPVGSTPLIDPASATQSHTMPSLAPPPQPPAAQRTDDGPRPSAPRPSHRRRGVAIAAAGGLTAAVVLIILGIMRNGGTPAAAPPSPSSSTSGPAAATAKVKTTTPASSTTPPSASASSPRPASSSPASSTATVPTGPQQAVISYYQLVPNHLAQAWTHMTADYQQNHAGGYAAYQRFWNAIARVNAENVIRQSDDSVVATLVYVYKDGRTIAERTSFSLVQDDGEFKIAQSTVLSSRTV